MIGLGLNCCCGNCDWCTDYDAFGAIKAVFEFYGWTSLSADLYACCPTWEGFTIETTQHFQVDPAVAATDPPCDLDETVTAEPYCYYRRRGAFCSGNDGLFAVDSVLEIRFYVYQAGADLRGAVFVTVEEIGIGSAHSAAQTAKADFVIAAGASSTECGSFALTGEALTVCSTTGTPILCGLPTTFDLEMAVV